MEEKALIQDPLAAVCRSKQGPARDVPRSPEWTQVVMDEWKEPSFSKSQFLDVGLLKRALPRV